MKKILALLLALVLVLSLAACSNYDTNKNDSNNRASNKFEGSGFSSPEKAVTAYIDALREGDIGKMLSTYAIESYAERFDFEAYARKYPSILLSAIGMPLPAGGTYRPEMNIYSRLSAVFGEIRYGYFALIGVDPYTTKHIPLGDEMEAGIEALTKELCGNDFEKKIAQIKTGNILTGDDLEPNEEVLEYTLNAYSSYLGVNEFCEVAIEVEFDGKAFLLYMLTAKIDGHWYNLTTSCPTGLMYAAQNDTNLVGGFLVIAD